MAVKSIIVAVDAQYVKNLEKNYIGYKKKNIRKMVEQLQTWSVIITKEKLAIKAHFLETWSNTPNTHIKTFACQMERRQVECEDHGFTVTKAYKVDHFVAQIYACDLFEAKILDNW